MTEIVWKSEYDINVIDIRLFNQPRLVEININKGNVDTKITLINPVNLGSLTELLDDCWELRIIDKNKLDNAQLEFGRCELEIWDEDNTIGTIQCDGYSIDDI
jgi:hypothetical protein